MVYKDIDEPETIVYTNYSSDAEGSENEAMSATEVTMAFIDQGGKTKLVSRSEYVSTETLEGVTEMGMLQSITETWDRLEERLGEVITPFELGVKIDLYCSEVRAGQALFD